MSEFSGVRWKQKPQYTADGEERCLCGADVMPLTHAPYVDGEEADGAVTIDSLSEMVHRDVACLGEKTEFSKDGTVVSIEDGKAYKGTLDCLMATKTTSLSTGKLTADIVEVSCATASSLCVTGDITQSDGSKLSETYVKCLSDPVTCVCVTTVDEVQTLNVTYLDDTSNDYTIDSRAVLECTSLPSSPASKVYNVGLSDVTTSCGVTYPKVNYAKILPYLGCDHDCFVSELEKLTNLTFDRNVLSTCSNSGGSTILGCTYGVSTTCISYLYVQYCNSSNVNYSCLVINPYISGGCITVARVAGTKCTSNDYSATGCKVYSKDIELTTKDEFDALSVNCIHNDDCSQCISTLDSTNEIKGNTNIAGDLTITGNIYQSGSSYITCAEDLNVEDSTITLRSNAESSLSSSEYSGIVVCKYDGTNDLNLFVDSEGTARLGVSTSLCPFALRDEADNLTDGCPLVWNSTTKTLVNGTFPGDNIDDSSVSTTTTYSSSKISTTYLSLSGGTMTGALNLANNTKNLAGDDAYYGDGNMAGAFVVQGCNGPTRLVLVDCDCTWGDTSGDAASYGYIQYDGDNLCMAHRYGFIAVNGCSDVQMNASWVYFNDTSGNACMIFKQSNLDLFNHPICNISYLCRCCTALCIGPICTISWGCLANHGSDLSINTVCGGELSMSDLNNNGQLFMQIDGTIYVCEGKNPVASVSSFDSSTGTLNLVG